MPETCEKETEVEWLRTKFSQMQDMAERHLRKSIENEERRKVAENRTDDKEKQIFKHMLGHIVSIVLLGVSAAAIAIEVLR